MQQVASPQVAKVQPWEDSARQIRAREDAGDLPGATELAAKLVADLERSDPDGILLPGAVDRLAILQHNQGHYVEAAQLYENAVELWRRRPDSPNLGLAKELNNLASLYSEVGQAKKAETLRQKSLTVRLRLLGPASPEVALCYSNLAVDAIHEGNYHDAERLANLAIKIWGQGPPGRSDIDLAYNTLAMIELHAHRYGAALKDVRLALQTYDRHGGGDASRLAAYQHTLALAEQYTGDSVGAAQAFQASLTTIASTNATVSIQRIIVLQDYATLLRSMGQKHEARKLKQEAAKELVKASTHNPFKYSVDASALLSSQH
jgi:tetratricopeptide (TPR) repeat protein